MAQIVILTATMPELIREAAAVGATLEQEFGDLSLAQLNWRPNPDEWSIGYCLEHLITVHTSYFEPINQILAGTKPTNVWQHVPFLPGMFGPMLIRSLEPGAKRRVEAPKVFLPSSTTVADGVMARFAAQQQTLLDLMERCQALDPARIIISSPAASFVTYSLLDAFRIIVVHLHHHLQQMRGLRELL